MGHHRRQGEPLIDTLFRAAVVAAFGLGATACTASPSGGAAASPDAPIVVEAWESKRYPAANIDSLAAWKTGDGAVWLLATGKESHDLIVFDAATGATLRRVGEKGDALGSFRRPNGIAVAGDLCLVVERDNHRVQALALPSFEPIAVFGEEDLKKPYGISVTANGEASVWDVFVTDAYETANGEVPPVAELGARVKQYRVRADGPSRSVHAELVRTFGETGAPGALRVVESLEIDPLRSWILIAEEEETSTFIKVYGVDGRFTGKTVGEGLFRHQVEGIALRSCSGDDGFWVVSDQGTKRTEFHLLDRRTLEPIGKFIGRKTANTDGIAIHTEPFGGFPNGALFAVDDDAAVAAFRWNDVSRALSLRDCG